MCGPTGHQRPVLDRRGVGRGERVGTVPVWHSGKAQATGLHYIQSVCPFWLDVGKCCFFIMIGNDSHYFTLKLRYFYTKNTVLVPNKL